MNLLPLVFSIMLIFSYGYYAIWDKHVNGVKLQNSYTSHHEANREIWNEFESQYYSDLGKKVKKRDPNKPKTERNTQKQDKPKKILSNGECARINLWPLIQEGREKHQALYELSAKLLKTFYGSLSKEKRFEYNFLDALLSSAKKANLDPFSLEKIAFEDPRMRLIYYKMLKGSKKWDLQNGVGYPPILDFVKAEPAEEKICIFHSHPAMLNVLFNPQTAERLNTAIHQEKVPLTPELVQRICFETHIISLSPDLLNLLQFSGYQKHKDKKPSFFATSGDVELRKNLKILKK